MGREGVAYTFVTPDEGHELTRIEERINRLLKRDEMPGFDALRPVASPAAALPTAAADSPEAKPPAPPPSLGGRKKKYRRAL